MATSLRRGRRPCRSRRDNPEHRHPADDHPHIVRVPLLGRSPGQTQARRQRYPARPYIAARLQTLIPSGPSGLRRRRRFNACGTDGTATNDTCGGSIRLTTTLAGFELPPPRGAASSALTLPQAGASVRWARPIHRATGSSVSPRRRRSPSAAIGRSSPIPATSGS